MKRLSPPVASPTLTIRAKFFRGLADPSRLAILEALRDGEQTVGELVAATGLTQSNTSNHLACLRDCGLVASRQEWRSVYYRLAHEAVAQLLRAADDLIAVTSEEIAACETIGEGGGDA